MGTIFRVQVWQSKKKKVSATVQVLQGWLYAIVIPNMIWFSRELIYVSKMFHIDLFSWNKKQTKY